VSGEARTQEKPDFTEMLKVARVAAPLAADERALAIRLAEQALRSNKMLPDKKTVLTLVQTHRNIEAEKKGTFERHALLTYYRYTGDLGILVYVNLIQQRVIRVEQLPHFPAPLGLEEHQRAKELALNHPQLKKMLELYRDRLTVEALLTRSAMPTDPRFRHRMVYLLFRVGPRYLTALGEVFVDLTDETLIIQSTMQREGEGHKQ
jgi:hypothetical protein